MVCVIPLAQTKNKLPDAASSGQLDSPDAAPRERSGIGKRE